MIIFSVETSCDDTSAAIIKNRKVLSNITVLQNMEQTKSGVQPGLAAKLHVYNFQKVIKKVLEESGIEWNQVDYLAYTKEPGLSICLQIGKTVIETLSLYLKKKIIPINHLEAHIFSSLINNKKKWIFPALGLIISGGHTQMYILKDYNTFTIIGETKDDAIGECLDKIAFFNGFSYPGGPKIEELAKKGKNVYKFPFPKNDKSFDFSFSGLKSAVFRFVTIKKNTNINDLACSLQFLLKEILTKKIKNAIEKYPDIKTVIFGGGVTANSFLKKELKKEILKKQKKFFFWPKIEYSGDNAAMIAVRAYFKLKKK